MAKTHATTLTAFLLLVTVLCGGFILLMQSLGQQGYALAQAYMLTPAIAAILTRLLFYPRRFADAHLGIGRLADYLRFWLIGLGIVALQSMLYTVLGAIRWDLSGNTFLAQLSQQMADAGQDINDLPPGITPHLMLWLFFLGGLTVFNIVPGLLTGFGEEFGWRGLMFPLLYRLQPWLAFVGGGLIWFAWHVPLTLVFPPAQPLSPEQTAVNLGALAVGSLFTFTFLAYVYVKSESIWVVSFAHIAINNASRSLSYFVVVEDAVRANLVLALAAGLVVGVLFWSGELRAFGRYFTRSADTVSLSIEGRRSY